MCWLRDIEKSTCYFVNTAIDYNSVPCVWSNIHVTVDGYAMVSKGINRVIVQIITNYHFILCLLAGTVGFKPTEQLPTRSLSRREPSITQPSTLNSSVRFSSGTMQNHRLVSFTVYSRILFIKLWSTIIPTSAVPD